MGTVIVRYRTREDTAEENQRLVEQVFAELEQSAPDGVRYASFRMADGVTFVHVAHMDGPDNPLAELAAFREFQSTIGDRCAEPPSPQGATVVGAYRFQAG